MPPWINFKELRRQLKFADVLRHYKVEAKIKGDRATAFCPLPGHPKRPDGGARTASLSVNLTRNIFKCFGCQQSGNALEFACRMEGCDPSNVEQFRQAALKIAETFKINAIGAGGNSKTPQVQSPPQAATATLVNAPLDFELKDLDAEHPYLFEREFLPETIQHFGLGYCNRGMLKGRAAIPLHDLHGSLVGYAGRITQDELISDACPKYLFPGERQRNGLVFEFRKSLLLYNAHRITTPVDHLFVVEGFTATWHLWQAKYRTVVALMGSDCSDAQASFIVNMVKPDGKVWAMPDGNEAGVLCAMSILKKVAPHRLVRWVRLEQNEQPTDYSLDELVGLFGS